MTILAPPSFMDVLTTAPSGEHTGVFALIDIPADAEIALLVGDRLSHASKYTIQIDDRLHLDTYGSIHRELLHSCDANAWVDSRDIDRPVVRTRREIPAGVEVTINYCASEDAMSEPFSCTCEAAECYRTVQGYAHLTDGQRAAIEDHTSPYLLRKYGRT